MLLRSVESLHERSLERSLFPNTCRMKSNSLLENCQSPFLRRGSGLVGSLQLSRRDCVGGRSGGRSSSRGIFMKQPGVLLRAADLDERLLDSCSLCDQTRLHGDAGQLSICTFKPLVSPPPTGKSSHDPDNPNQTVRPRRPLSPPSGSSEGPCRGATHFKTPPTSPPPSACEQKDCWKC